MSALIRKGMLLLAMAFWPHMAAHAQQTPAPAYTTDIDVAVTYVAERAKVASTDCGCFWLEGGSGDFAITLFRGLGVAANLTGEHVSSIGSGIGSGLNLDKVMFAAGPRYTYSRKKSGTKGPGPGVFGEALFGRVHGFDTFFPTSQGGAGAAGSFAMQLGGGVDLRFARHFGIRPVEVEYVRSSLPNNASHTQDDLRVAGGLSFHFTATP